MKRRDFLRAATGGGLTAGLAGCLGFELQSGGVQEPAIPDDRPNGVYVPSHTEGARMIDTGENGDYAAGLMYSYPHRFWVVNGESVDRTSIEESDDVHLMTSVWDPETRRVLPETGLSLEITKDGELVSQEVIYPMLSQPMGFHYGANFGLDGDGEYTVRLSVGAVGTRTTGAFRDRFTEPATIEISFEYRESARDEIPFERLDDRAGEPGVVEQRQMAAIPDSTAPAQNAMPGSVLGSPSVGDVRYTMSVLDPPAGIDGDGRYLVVSPRTAYTGSVLPGMKLESTVTRDGSTVYDGTMTRTLHPELSYHYGAVLEEFRFDERLTITPALPPQVSRHEGYETAFGGRAEMEPLEYELST